MRWIADAIFAQIEGCWAGDLQCRLHACCASFGATCASADKLQGARFLASLPSRCVLIYRRHSLTLCKPGTPCQWYWLRFDDCGRLLSGSAAETHTLGASRHPGAGDSRAPAVADLTGAALRRRYVVRFLSSSLSSLHLLWQYSPTSSGSESSTLTVRGMECHTGHITHQSWPFRILGTGLAALWTPPYM